MSDIGRLLEAMTLEEKIGQLTMDAGAFAVTGPIAGGDLEADARAGRVGSLLNLWGEAAAAIQSVAARESRLRIPLLIGFDALHGHRTIFPIPLAEACAFDPPLWRASAAATAREARADGISLVFAPMLDIARDPRWGRIAEGPGEDPFVASLYAKAKVEGLQGGALRGDDSVAACAKHFCAYGAATAGRDYASADVSERALAEIYLPPFAAALEAGCAAIMPAFMDLAGVPMTANQALLGGWLREAQGFRGVVVSDYNALGELIAHGVAADLIEAAALALRAGVDIDMMGFAYRKGLPGALERGLVAMDEIDAAVLRVLGLKQKLGLFEAREVPPRRGRESAQTLALEAARRSIVLLTNRGVLPLAAATRRIALIGPLADAAREMDGPWAAAGEREAAVSILAGLRAALPGADIVCAPGVELDGADDHGADDQSADDLGLNAALAICRDADLILLCVGEGAAMSGEAASRADLGLPGRQRELAERALDLSREVGTPLVALIESGRPLTAPFLFERADAALAIWHLGETAGRAIADVLTGAFNPVGRLPVTWPRSVGQIPLCYAERPGGRPFAAADPYTSKYLDCPNEPQFVFGHGLSYSRFALRNLRLDREQFGASDTLEFSVEVANEGPMAGEATVFLFARDSLASVARPLLELKGFGRIALQAGESGALALLLRASDLAFPGVDLSPRFEPGAFEFFVGFSADRAGFLSVRAAAVAS